VSRIHWIIEVAVPGCFAAGSAVLLVLIASLYFGTGCAGMRCEPGEAACYTSAEENAARYERRMEREAREQTRILRRIERGRR
jgi:hypothetical protein